MDSCSIFLVVFIGGIFVVGIIVMISASNEADRVQRMTPAERDAYLDQKRRAATQAQAKLRDAQHGPLNMQMVCPHCHKKGSVRTKNVKQKKGISGGKATAAVLTGGVSILATGLSRKEAATEATCDKCGSTWHF